MFNLSAFLGRRNAAGYKKLAAFFLLSLLYDFTIFSQNIRPFSVNGKINLFNVEKSVIEKNFTPQGTFLMRGVCSSGKKGFILAWNQKTQQLLHIKEDGKILASVQAPGNNVFINKNYILQQSNSWTENRGFEFTFSKIKYSKLTSKISLKKQWNGFIDCFVSDCIFTENGVYIAGGTKDNLTHNVYSISQNGIHKCFSMPKKSDFLRIVRNPLNDAELFAFLSQREKIAVSPSVYCLDVNTRSDSTTSTKYILSEFENFPVGFECFFGYGFILGNDVVFPCSIEKAITFVKCNIKTKTIDSVTPQAIGCNFPLFANGDAFYYIAKDPLDAHSFYGIATYDGKSIEKIVSFE